MPSVSEKVSQAVEIAQDTLRRNFVEFVTDLSNVFDKLPSIGGFIPTKVEVMASISAEGGVELVGKLSAGISGGVTNRI